MTTSAQSRTVRHQPDHFSSLGLKLGTQIFEKVMQSSRQEPGRTGLPLTPEQSTRAAARALTNLCSVNKTFQKWALETRKANPDVEMETTGNTIKNMAGLDNANFRRRMARLLRENQHIRVYFSQLSPDQAQIVLEELSAEAIPDLRRVNMDIPYDSGIPLREVETAAPA